MFKSGLLLKDRTFVPDYNSHTEMLEELHIDDTRDNMRTTFIRFEISPKNGDIFTDIGEWKYKVDQDYTPDWYVAEYDEHRARTALKDWVNRYQNKRGLGELNVGDKFTIGNIEYIVLDKDGDNVSCLTVGFINDRKQFSENTNMFSKSSIKNYLNGTYFDWISGEIGEENIIEHDCLGKDYKVSLLTVEKYKKYRDIIQNAENWWWLADAYEGTSYDVHIVGSLGGLNNFGYYDGVGGVRPFCIFKSSIFVSCR
jgi:hypothetical protein